jgi:integration host factor subunit beta
MRSWICQLEFLGRRRRPRASPDRSSSAASMSVSSEIGGKRTGRGLDDAPNPENLIIPVLDEIAGALERGMRVELRGFGVLTVKGRRARQGRNPRTGEALIIDPHRVVRFRVSELLLARLNQPSRRPERPKSNPRQLAD